MYILYYYVYTISIYRYIYFYKIEISLSDHKMQSADAVTTILEKNNEIKIIYRNALNFITQFYVYNKKTIDFTYRRCEYNKFNKLFSFAESDYAVSIIP